MTSVTVVPHPEPNCQRTDPPGGTVPQAIVEELCSYLFPLLRRKDQRQKAGQYLYGLLTTQGRKSIRNIAATVGEPATVQNLHHFIADSTWDWRPFRAALASYVESVAPAQAWVVQPMSVPKAGERSVGVDEFFDPQLGQMFWGQQAFGVWSASQELSVPINWRLFLPGFWGHDATRRERAEVPLEAGGETVHDCAVAAALTAPRGTRARRRPVVLNIPGSATRTTMARFAAVGAPVLARATASSRWVVADHTMPGFGPGAHPAQAILESVKSLRRPVQWFDAAQPRLPRSSLVAAVPVTLPNLPAGRRRPLLLLGEWRDPRRPPTQLWLTDMVKAPVSGLLPLVKLVRRVDRDASRVGDAVGLRDFVGRSFRGWHRHITLASVAHAVMMLTVSSERPSYGALLPSA